MKENGERESTMNLKNLLYVDKNLIKFNSIKGFDTLYFYKLLSKNEETIFINMSDLENIYLKGQLEERGNAYLFYILQKKKDRKEKKYILNMYLATFNEKIRDIIKTLENISDMDEESTFYNFLDLLSLNTNFILNKNKTLKLYNFMLESNFINFFQVYKNLVDIEKKCFISIPYSYFSIDMLSALNSLESYVAFFTFKFNNLKAELEEKKNYNKFVKKGYKYFTDLILAYNEQKEKITSMNLILFTDEEKVDKFFKSLSLGYIKAEGKKYEILYKSPFFYIPNEYSTYFYLEDIRKMFLISKERNKIKEKEDLQVYLSSRNKYLYTFSFKSEPTAPHTFIVGKTGSGKSVSTLKFLTNILGFYKLENENDLEKIKADIKVRYFDVGQTAYLLFKALQKVNKNIKIEISSPEVNKIYFNILEDIYRQEEEEEEENIEFAVSMIEFAYSLLTKNKIDAKVRATLKKVIKEMKDILDKRVVLLKSIKYNESLYKKLKEKGYSDTDNIVKEKEILNNITLICLYKEIKERSYSVVLTEKEKKEYEEARKVLDIIIRNFPQISYFSSVNLKNVDYLYLELSKAKHYKIFPIFILYVLKKLMKEDLKFTENYKIYVIEEAHTFFENKEIKESLNNIFSYLTREARKYKVMLIFISQLLSDLNEVIVKNIPNFLILKAKENDEIIKEAEERLILNENMLKLLRKLKKHEGFLYSTCFSSVKFDLTPFEEMLYTKNRIKIKDEIIEKI